MADTHGTGALKPEQRFTLADWRTWPADERWELIDGVAYAMSPSPKTRHQGAARDLLVALSQYLKGKPCIPFMAPLDVFLDETADGSEAQVVEPDVFVVCDPAKVGEDGIHGAPDFVAEVLSDSTAYRDQGVKLALYERSGVGEYWIIHPDSGSVWAYVRQGTGFAPVREYRKGQPVPSAVLPGFAWTFPD